MNKYVEIGTLNNGSYGTVQLVKELRTSRMHAAKRVSLALSSRKEVEDEIAVHERVAAFPRVAKLVDHFLDPDANEYVLIIEYCSGGDLHDRIARGHPLSLSEIKKVSLQLVDTLEYCHGAGVYHRDVKPENIFLQHNGAIKLGDWGLATLTRNCTDFGTGSDMYMAPECFDRTAATYDAAQADIWAVGIVLLNMLFGRTPFKQATERDVLFTDFARSRESLYDVFPTLTRDVFNALRHSLTMNPAHRSLAKMREAILNIRHWTTDDEMEELSASLPNSFSAPVAGSHPGSLTGSLAGSLGERSAARRVPVVHKPFRVPTAVAHSLQSPTSAWDRRKMYTPPTSASPLQHPRSKPGRYRLSMHLPRHLEQPDEEEETIPTKRAPKLDADDDSKELSSPSSPSSTSSTSSLEHKVDSIFAMDGEDSDEEFSESLPIDDLPPKYSRIPVYR